MNPELRVYSKFGVTVTSLSELLVSRDRGFTLAYDFLIHCMKECIVDARFIHDKYNTWVPFRFYLNGKRIYIKDVLELFRDDEIMDHIGRFFEPTTLDRCKEHTDVVYKVVFRNQKNKPDGESCLVDHPILVFLIASASISPTKIFEINLHEQRVKMSANSAASDFYCRAMFYIAEHGFPDSMHIVHA